MILVFLLLMIACNQTQEPIIKVEASISKLSEKEYKRVGTQNLEHPVRDDFKTFTFQWKLEHGDEMTSRTIDMPDWKSLINSIDGKRYWYGNSDEQEDENLAQYTNEIVFYSKGLRDEQLREAFESAKLTVSWDTKEGKTVTKEYVIGDLIEFKE